MLSVLAIPAVITGLAAAQGASGPQWHRVSSDNAFIRCDASATVAYPVGRLPRDTMVLVLEDRFGWAKVRPDGDAFDRLSGFIPATNGVVADDASKVTLSMVTPLKATNFAAKEDPTRSWKEIARLDAGTTLELIETVVKDDQRFLKVRLPANAEVWINQSFLVAATPAEIAALSATAQGDPEPASNGDLELIAATSTVSPSVVGADPIASPGDETDLVGDDVLVGTAAVVEHREPTLDDLEAVWSRFLDSEADAADAIDFVELRDRYVTLASASDSSASVRGRARLRAEQIRLQSEIQNRVSEIKRLQEQSLMDLQAIREVREVMESRGDYEAVGRLHASLVYDGKRLPLLYRVQEPGEGSTIAYVIPTRDFKLAEMTGQLVGVAGDLRYDEALRLNLITPRRVEILTEVAP